MCDAITIEKTRFLLRNNHLFEVAAEASDGVSRKLVYCIGRRFFFQSWHLLITYLELARLHQVDMVVLYLLNIDSAVFELSKRYEASGFLRIRTSLKMPTEFKEMGVNPNLESEWNNEAIEYNECLYEHREHADFIAFTTMDDIIISSPPNFVPLPPILTELSFKYPESAELLLRVHDAFLQNLDEIAGNLKSNNPQNLIETVHNFWRHGIYMTGPIADLKPTAEISYTKLIVTPLRVEVVWLHRAWKMESGRTPIFVPYDKALVMHLRHPLQPGYNDTFPQIKQLNTNNATLHAPLLNSSTDKMSANFGAVLNSTDQNVSQLVARLPRTESFLNEMRKFNTDIVIKIKKDPRAISQCSNYLHHDPLTSRMKFGCINAQNIWKNAKVEIAKNAYNRVILNIFTLGKRLFNLEEKCTDF